MFIKKETYKNFMGNVYPTESTCDMIKTIIRKEKGAVKHMREITVVENVLLCADGAVMKDGPDCLVEKLPDGRIQARFENPAGEQRTVKFTLTGLTPHVGFQVRMEHAGNTETGPRRANRAGVLELQTDMPEDSRMFIIQETV